MESLSMQLRFMDFNELPEDKVQSIKNILNCPCSAVQLPIGVSLSDVNSFDSNRPDGYDQGAAELEVETTVSYGVPVVTMVNHYPTHVQQAPMYPMANGNFLATANQIPHLVFVSEGMSMDGLPNGAAPSLKQSLESGCNSNGPNSGGVVSAPYHHLGMFQCPQQYVVPHVHPAYISTYMSQPQASPVRKSTMAAAAELSMPSGVSDAANFVNQHVPVSSLLPMPIVAPACPSYKTPADPETQASENGGDSTGEEEDVGLEHVVVEVPSVIDLTAPSAAVPAPAVSLAMHEQKPLDTGKTNVDSDGFNFMCEDQLNSSDKAATQEAKPDKVECELVVNTTATDEVLQLLDGTLDGVTRADSASTVTKQLSEGDSQKPKCSPVKKVKQPVAQEAPTQAKLWTSLFKSSPSAAPPVESLKNNNVTTTTSMSSPRMNVTKKPSKDQVEHCSDQPALQANSGTVKSLDNTFKRNGKKREANLQKKDVSKSNGIVTKVPAGPTFLGDILTETALDNRHPKYMMRGLRNCGNWCYVNSILQALLACDPLCNLLHSLKACHALGQLKTSSPIIDSMVEFIIEYAITPDHKVNDESHKNGNKRALAASFIGPVFDPVCVYDMLPHLKLNAFEGRQEDAEEFLSCLLNGLHDEMARAMTHSNNASATNAAKSVGDNNAVHNGKADNGNESEEEESWKVIEPRNKCSITRSTSFSSSPLSDIFCGRMRSAVHASSSSSATLQPFFTLQLDVQSENVTTVAEALHLFVMKESLQDYHCAKTKQEIVASRQITLEELPPVLILHLKRFVYCKDGGCMKVSKKVDFDINLHFQKELLSPAARAKISPKQRNYKLVAVVYHCGDEAVKGHYITDVCHDIGDVWFRTDDSRVSIVWQSAVLNHPRDFVPYLLFYRNMGAVQVPHQQQPPRKDVASVK